MNTLTPSERRALRAKAHHLHPVVIVGQHGLTPPVLHEIDIALTAHELVKIRVSSDVRADREALLERICTEMEAAPVQHLGKILTVWRPAPKAEPEAKAPATRAKPAARGRKPAPTSTGAAGKRRTVSGGKAPQERRRAPATTKGPFEPGKRTPRAATSGKIAAGGSASAPRSRRPAAGAGKGVAEGAGASARRGPRAGRDDPATAAAPAPRRRRRQT